MNSIVIIVYFLIYMLVHTLNTGFKKLNMNDFYVIFFLRITDRVWWHIQVKIFFN